MYFCHHNDCQTILCKVVFRLHFLKPSQQFLELGILTSFLKNPKKLRLRQLSQGIIPGQYVYVSSKLAFKFYLVYNLNF